MLLRSFRAVACVFMAALFLVPHARAAQVTDALGATVDVPDSVSRVICSGSGCLRLLTYLQGQDLVVGVDDMETRRARFDSRPYALATPQYKTKPVFGQFRGHDNPERILTLEPQPQVILKTYASSMGHDPAELHAKTGIPVVTLAYADLGPNRPKLYQTLRTMGDVIGKRQRAEDVIAFFEDAIADLAARTADVPASKRPGVYIGGVAFKGPHGYHSTEPLYPPFTFVNARNLAHTGGAAKDLRHSDIAKEKLVEMNPEVLFLDLSTVQMGDAAGGLHELRNDPAYRTLTAVQQGRVYGMLPYNWYSINYGSILANAYAVGKILYPDRFADIDPAQKADEIYTFLVGKPVFDAMNTAFGGLAYSPVPVN